MQVIVSSILLMGPRDKTDCQAWQQVPLPSEPSY